MSPGAISEKSNEVLDKSFKMLNLGPKIPSLPYFGRNMNFP